MATKRKLKLEKSDTPAKAEAPKANVKEVKPTAGKEKVKKSAIDQGVTRHEIAGSYNGSSAVFNARKSRTAILLEQFNTTPDAPMTNRLTAALNDLANTYNKSSFERGNLDAGVIRRLGARGYLQHVEGANTDPKAKFKLTAKAFPATK